MRSDETEVRELRKPAGCRRCGACCRALLLEADLLDAEREPLIAQHGGPMKGLDGYVESYCLNADGPDHRCVFLADDNRCTIYPTRPNMCVAFGPGDERCAIVVAGVDGRPKKRLKRPDGRR